MSQAPVRVACPDCESLSAPAGFRVEGARLFLTCGRCGAEQLAVTGPAELPTRETEDALRVVPRAPETGPAPEPMDAQLFNVPEGHCPKCVAPRPSEALACSACGLVFTNFTPREQVLPPLLAAAWQRLQTRWEQRAAHDALLAQAHADGQLAAAGRLCRIRLAHESGDVEARRALDEVVRLALLPSERAETHSDALPGMARTTKLVLALLFLLLCLSGGALLLSAAARPLP